jgi:hypothetical protein
VNRQPYAGAPAAARLVLFAGAVPAWACLAIAVAAQTPDYAPIPGIGFVADVPLVEPGGIPCVMASLEGRPESLFCLDTGNIHSSVSLKAARAAGLKLAALPPPVPAGYFVGLVPALRIGGVAFKDLRVVVTEFGKNVAPPEVVGTLAYPLFKDRIVQFDFAKGRFRFTGAIVGPSSLPGIKAGLSRVNFGKGGPKVLVAEGIALDGVPLTSQVDTMFTGSILVYTASRPKVGMAGASTTSAMEYFPFTDGGVSMATRTARSVTFEGIPLGHGIPKVYFPVAGVHEPDGLFDCTIGTALLNGAILTLDLHNDTVSVARP